MNVIQDGDSSEHDEFAEAMEDANDTNAAIAAEDDDMDFLEEDEEELSENEVDDVGGVPVSLDDIPMINNHDATITDAASSISQPADSSIAQLLNPQRPTPYVYDAGHLLITDPNPVPQLPGQSTVQAREALLTATARDAAQSLLNHLLTTCPISASQNSGDAGSGVTMKLPEPEFKLPREKHVPVPKPPTKWELFAAKKGIGKNKKKGEEGPNRAGKMVYDEATGEWVPRYGYRGANKKAEDQWLVEIDEKEEKKRLAEGKETGGNPRAQTRRERKERIKRQERKQRQNESRAASTSKVR